MARRPRPARSIESHFQAESLMIPYSKFGRLRLSKFLKDAEIEELEDWEFENRIWVGEAVGFSEFLCPAENPKTLGSIAIDFAEFPEKAAKQVLEAIELPLRAGMTVDEVKGVLGEPAETLRFTAGKASYEFLTTDSEPYKVSCTVKDKGGLSYLVVMVPG
jgi:hypothetical protein